MSPLTECETTIRQELARHSRLFGGISADLEQEAYLAAVMAIANHQPTIYPLTLWVRLAVRSHLLSVKRCSEQPVSRLPAEISKEIDEPFCFEKFLNTLTDDAREVVKIIFDPDPNFWRPHPSYRSLWLRLLYHRLRREKWTVSRITDAFSCIRNALI